MMQERAGGENHWSTVTEWGERMGHQGIGWVATFPQGRGEPWGR